MSVEFVRVKISKACSSSLTIDKGFPRRCASYLHAEELLVRTDADCIEVFAAIGHDVNLSQTLAKFLEKETGRPIKALVERRHELNTSEAVGYFLRAAVGMTRDGELRQSIQDFRRAFDAARDLGLTGPNLNRLFQRGLWLAEKVRLELHLHKDAITPQSVVTDLAQKIFGDLNDHTALVFGDSSTSRAFVEKLREKNLGGLLFAAPNGEGPARWEGEFAAKKIPREQLIEALTSVDILLLFDADLDMFLNTVKINKIMSRRNNAPLLFVSYWDQVPGERLKRKDLNDIYNIYYYNSFDLDQIVTSTLREHQKISHVVDALIEQETKDFLTWVQTKQWFRYGNIIGKSQAMQDILELVARIAQTDISVLIDGESGTGKELVARAIHEHSTRSRKKFVAVNCGAMTETLLESEMFGHVRGAFTGATVNKKGLFEESNHGTILLDEIGETSQAMQVKLLRFLQEGEIKPVGSNETLQLDVRLITATNRDLAGMVEEGTFRQDLYYRLNVIQVTVPPLRDRREDILPLVEFFIARYAQKFHKTVFGLEDTARRALCQYHWPGNVRELENTIERAVALSPEKLLGLGDLPAPVLTPQSQNNQVVSQADQSLKELEKTHIAAALQEHDWNYDLVTKILGIGRTTLWRKMKAYNISKTSSGGGSADPGPRKMEDGGWKIER